MIKIALKNSRFLEKISKIPILKHFFILKVSENFQNITSDAVLNKFYKDIYVNNKTAKTTSRNRFPDLNKLSTEIIEKQENPVIHDVAVSSGISSAEFYDLLKSKNPDFQFYISDKYSEISVKKGFITRAFDTERNLTFAYFGCFFAVDKNIFFPLTVLLFKIIRKLKTPEKFDYNLLLFHPEILQKIKNNSVNFINYDIFETALPQKFTFVRVMNILNLGYFSENRIKTALKNILNSIKEDGVMLVGRTNSKGINNASFFRKRNNCFVFIKNINEGSEIKRIIENL